LLCTRICATLGCNFTDRQKINAAMLEVLLLQPVRRKRMYACVWNYMAVEIQVYCLRITLSKERSDFRI